MFADELRLEAAFPLPEYLNANRIAVGQHGLCACAVPVVADPLGLGLSSFMAQVVAHLGTQGPLDGAFLKFWKMSPNCSLMTRPGMTSSSSLAGICGCAVLPLLAGLVVLRGRKLLCGDDMPHT